MKHGDTRFDPDTGRLFRVDIDDRTPESDVASERAKHFTIDGLANVIAWALNDDSFDGPARIDPQKMASGAVDIIVTDPSGKTFGVRIFER